jgi:hypothetical protein
MEASVPQAASPGLSVALGPVSVSLPMSFGFSRKDGQRLEPCHTPAL